MNRTSRVLPWWLRGVLAVAPLALVTSCASTAVPPAAPAGSATVAEPKQASPEEARAFFERVNRDLQGLLSRRDTAEWIKATYITDDTERAAALAGSELMAYTNQSIQDSARFRGVALEADTARMLYLLRVGQSVAAPTDAQKRSELAGLMAKLEGLYGKGKSCGKDGKGRCRDLGELSEVLAKSRNYDELLEAWAGWHSISPPMRPLFERFVSLANEGAREIGFADMGALWRSQYDMSPEAFQQETERLWTQVKPLYDELHCYVRARLTQVYGESKVPSGKPIPAHLLGNMWAQEWNNIYPLVEPYAGQSSLNVDAELVRQGYDAQRMVKQAEGFFTSLGLHPLPQTFWERSLLTKPRDRDVVCHASAWDVTYSGDVRIKMCIKPTEEDLSTIHHELGHIYYYVYYHTLPVLFQSGAHDGFHEAIGDTIVLSITPGYLQQRGLLKEVPQSDKGLINLQLKDALSKVAFLPFGLLIDQWRWGVLSGQIKPGEYNQAWWALRLKYQGVAPPTARSEQDFDPGAKYHVPANTPYMRYFLARILQFQLYKALCQASGHKGPLHECSFYGNKEAGQRLQALLELGASKPWPDALEAVTGQRQMEAAPLLEYFTPLRAWLKEQNKGRTCGW